MPGPADAVVTVAHQRPPARRRRLAPLAYSAMVAAVAAQLEAQQLPGGRAGELLVVLPVVGFEAQSAAVLPEAIALLTAAVAGAGVVLALVNRPAARVADGTARWLRDWARRHPDRPLLTAELPLLQRPRLGELRQVAVDAMELAGGPMPASGRVVLADDDVVALPADTYARLGQALDRAALAIGPVLFDAHELPTCLLPELWLGDLFRALLVDRQVAHLERSVDSVPTGAIEALVLSSNLAVRRDALRAVGGLHDLNELTELVRDTLAAPAPAGLRAVGRGAALHAAGGDPVAELLRRAVRVHSRRALAAYAAADVPTVAQWRVARLRTSRVDPVRLSTPTWPDLRPLHRLGHRARQQAVAGAGRHLALVLDHVQPPVDDAAGVLEQLGLARHQVELVPPRPAGRWRVGVLDSSGLLERAVELQRDALRRPVEPAAAAAW